MSMKMKLGILAGSALLALSTFSQAFAQPPGGGGGRGGRGFGMGGISSLLRMEEVRTHLNVTEDTMADINKQSEEARAGLNFASMRDLGEDERRELMSKMQEATDKIESKLSEILDPDQFDRLLGLYAQQQGASALTNKQVAAAIGLSEETVAKLKAKQEELRAQNPGFGGFGGGRPPRGGEGGRPEGDRPQGGPGFGGGDFNPEEFRAQMEKAREERDAALFALISEEEKAKFEKLKGEKFEFPQFGGFGGGRGGRDRGGDRSEGGEKPAETPAGSTN